MRNNVIIAILALISISCSIQTNNNNDIKSNPSKTNPESSSTTLYPIEPTLTPRPIPTPIADTTGLYLYGRDEVFYCEKKENIKVKLDRPVNIAVKKDGSELNKFYRQNN